MSVGTSLQRLLEHAQRLATLTSADEILAASCREVMALTDARRGFAGCSLPRQTWEHGVHIETDHVRMTQASTAARSALFAIHRRIVATSAAIAIPRDDTARAIFDGLACEPDVHTIHALPLVHRTGRPWGELVLIGPEIDPHAPGVVELARHTTIALEGAQRLAFARRDQDRLRLLAEATDDALYDWHFDTRDFWWGGGIVTLLGSETDPVEHTARWKHERVHPEDADRVRQTFEAVRASKSMRWNAEYRFRRNDGSYIHVEDRAYLLRDPDGRAYRAIGSMRDVTAMKQLLAREHEARAEAESASRAKDDFLAMLGHELRNPLAPIVTGLELARVRGTLDVDKDLPVLQRQAEHLIRLVDDLLDISRIAHGKIELRKERFEMAAVVAAAIETAAPLIDARLHTVEVRVPERGLELLGDRVRLVQAIGNLVTNAAKYTRPRGRISITATRTADEIAITVRDNGIGIAPEMLPHVFSMFVQERQALDRSQGGLGLGLSIVRSLVELHGGAVESKSDGVGRGSDFTIRLPAAGPAPIEVVAPMRDEIARKKGHKIVVVDDNQDAAELLSALLEQLGNTTRVAHDAMSALAVIEDFAPDLAVLDIGLPEIDGYELARRLRARADRVHLIALTGYGQPSDKERAASAGFDAHLVKPVAMASLRALIAQLTSS